MTAAHLGFKGLPEGALRTESELVRKSLGLEGEGGEIFKAHPHLTPEQEQEVQKNIIKNIHAQVRLAYEKFADRIKAKKLMIIGALYDFLAERKKGEYGKLIIENVNNEGCHVSGCFYLDLFSKLIIFYLFIRCGPVLLCQS